MKLKKLSIAIAVGVLFTGMTSLSFADDKWTGDVGSNWQDHVRSTKSRAQVMEELKQAREQGLVTVGEDPFYPRQPVATAGGRTRAEVRAEATQAANGAANSVDDVYAIGGGA